MTELFITASSRDGVTGWAAQWRAPDGSTDERLGRQQGLTAYRARLLALVTALTSMPPGPVRVHASKGTLEPLVTVWLPSWRAREFRKKGGIRDLDLVRQLDTLLATHPLSFAVPGTDGGLRASLRERLRDNHDALPTQAAVVPVATPTDATVLIYTDGGCRGTPGPGGWGAVLIHVPSGTTRILRGGDPSTTNNAMELTAVVQALGALTSGVDVEIRTDSQYVIGCGSEWLPGWRRRGYARANDEPLMNRDLIIALDHAQRPHRVRWTWVRGHAGEPGNELVDTLASRAMDEVEKGGTAALDQRLAEPPFAIGEASQ